MSEDQRIRIHGIESEDQGITCTHNPGIILLIDVMFSAKRQSIACVESSSQEGNWNCNRMDNENPPAPPPGQPIVPPMMVYSQLPTPAPMSLKGNLVEN